LGHDNDNVDISRGWESIRLNISSATERLNYWIKGNRPKCSGYRIQVKQMEIIGIIRRETDRTSRKKEQGISERKYTTIF